MGLLLGEPMQALHRHLWKRYNDGVRYKLHYVTAREMYNIIKAAERGLPGEPGEDPRPGRGPAPGGGRARRPLQCAERRPPRERYGAAQPRLVAPRSGAPPPCWPSAPCWSSPSAWTFHWMLIRWDAVNSYYSHGWLIPPIVAALSIASARQLAAARVRPCALGACRPAAVPVAPGAQHGVAGGVHVRLQLVGALVGLVLALFGPRCCGSCGVPARLSGLHGAPARSAGGDGELPAQAAGRPGRRRGAGHLGLPAVRKGSIIHIPTGTVVVDDVCSGLKYLISLTAFGALYAHISSVGKAQKAALFLVSVPDLLRANVIRVILMVLVGYTLGVATAEKWYFHGTLGFMLFAVAFVMLFLTEALFQRLGRSRPAKAAPRTAESLIAGRPPGTASRWALSGAFRTVLIALVVCARALDLPGLAAQERPRPPTSWPSSRCMRGRGGGGLPAGPAHLRHAGHAGRALAHHTRTGTTGSPAWTSSSSWPSRPASARTRRSSATPAGGYQIQRADRPVRLRLHALRRGHPLAVRELVVQYARRAAGGLVLLQERGRPDHQLLGPPDRAWRSAGWPGRTRPTSSSGVDTARPRGATWRPPVRLLSGFLSTALPVSCSACRSPTAVSPPQGALHPC